MSEKRLKAEIVRLYKLLDAISAAGDLLKPERTPYFDYVNKKSRECRNGIVVTNGFSLFIDENLSSKGEQQ